MLESLGWLLGWGQGFLSDVINGFFILFERQLDVGDEVVLTNGPITVSGKVVSVGIRTTQLRGRSGSALRPNRNITVVLISLVQTRPEILADLWYNRKSLINEGGFEKRLVTGTQARHHGMANRLKHPA